MKSALKNAQVHEECASEWISDTIALDLSSVKAIVIFKILSTKRVSTRKTIDQNLYDRLKAHLL